MKLRNIKQPIGVISITGLALAVSVAPASAFHSRDAQDDNSTYWTLEEVDEYFIDVYNAASAPGAECSTCERPLDGQEWGYASNDGTPSDGYVRTEYLYPERDDNRIDSMALMDPRDYGGEMPTVVRTKDCTFYIKQYGNREWTWFYDRADASFECRIQRWVQTLNYHYTKSMWGRSRWDAFYLNNGLRDDAENIVYGCGGLVGPDPFSN